MRLQALGERLEELGVVDVSPKEFELGLERLPRVVVDPRARVGRDRIAGVRPEPLVIVVPATDPDHLKALGQQASATEVVDGRQELSRGQVARAAKDDEGRRRGEWLLDVLGERVLGQSLGLGRGGHEPASTSLRGEANAGSAWASSSPASRAAPRTPASRPCRASLISVRAPTPGSKNSRATSRAGPSNSSPATETPPPTTTSSGSNVLIAFAIPTPSRSPRTRRAPMASGSPSCAARTTSRPST